MNEHPLQSKEWENFRKIRQPVDRQDGMLVMWSKIPLTPFYFGYVPMGKVPNNEEIKRLRDLGNMRKAIGIRIEPNATEAKTLDNLPRGRNLFKKKTIIIDLTKSEEELLKEMHPKGRYNIRTAQKHGVEVSEDNSDKTFAVYLDLLFGGTAKRQKIYSHGPKYHLQLWSALNPAGTAKIFKAEYAGKIVACAMVFCHNEGVYYAYGASALEHKEVMAQTLLMWKMIQWSKTKGYKFFDMWGSEDGTGFSRFKEQFGGNTVELAGSFDLPINNYGYWIFRLAEDMRWRILRMWK